MKKNLVLFFFLSITLITSAQLHDSLVEKGIKYGRKKQYDKAMECFDKALHIFPDNFNALFYKGFTFEMQEKYDLAIEYYSKSRYVFDMYHVYLRRGYCYSMIQQDSLAVLDLNIALEKNPKLTEAYLNRGHSLMMLKRYNEALDDYNKFLKKYPKNYDARNFKAYTLHQLGRYQESLNLYLLLIKEKPSNSYNCNMIADTYLELGKFQEALKFANKAIVLDHTYAIAHITKAQVLLKLNNKNDACKEYNIALECGADPSRTTMQELLKSCSE
jgi:tetratricopeptide (TPR) repeat protein